MAFAISEINLPDSQPENDLTTRSTDGSIWTIGTEDINGYDSPQLQKIAPDGTTSIVPGLPVGDTATNLFAGADGSVWATTGTRGVNGPGGHLVHVTANTTITTELPDWPEGGCLGPDGNIWLTFKDYRNSGDYQDSVTKFDVARGTLSVVEHGGFGTSLGTNYGKIAAGADGNLWFTECFSGQIIKMTTSGQATAYPSGLYTPDMVLAGGPIFEGSDGNIWLSGSIGSLGAVLAVVSPNGEVKPIALGTGDSVSGASFPRSVTAAPDGSMWYVAGGSILGHAYDDGRVVNASIFTPRQQADTIVSDGGTGLYVGGTVVDGSGLFAHVTTDAVDTGVVVSPRMFVGYTDRQSYDVTLASFTTPDASAVASDFQVFYQVGDGAIQEGYVIPNGQGSFLVQSSGSVYGQAVGVNAIKVTILDAKHGHTLDASATTTSQEIVASGSITVSPATLEFHTGLPTTGILATIHDPALNDLDAYQVLIDWGDGTSTSGSASTGNVRPAIDGGLGPAHDHPIQGSHIYARAGIYTIHLYAGTDQNEGDASWQVTVTDAPALAMNPVPIEVGTGLDGVIPVAYFSKPFDNFDLTGFTSTIDWGDGSTPTTTTAYDMKTYADLGIEIQGEHTYATAGSWTVHVTLANSLRSMAPLTLDEPATSIVQSFPLSTSVVSDGELYLLRPQIHEPYDTYASDQVAQAEKGAGADGSVWYFQYGLDLPNTIGTLYAALGSNFHSSNIRLTDFSGASNQDPFTTPGFVVIRAAVKVDVYLNSNTPFIDRTLFEWVYNVVAVHNAGLNLTVRSPAVIAGHTTRALLATFDSSGPSDVASNYSVTGTPSFGTIEAGTAQAPTVEPDPSGGFDVWSVVSPAATTTSGTYTLTIVRSLAGQATGRTQVSGVFQLTSDPLLNLSPVPVSLPQGVPLRVKVATFTSNPGASPGEFQAKFGSFPSAPTLPAEITVDPAGGFDVWATLYATGGNFPLVVSVSPTNAPSRPTAITADVVVTSAIALRGSDSLGGVAGSAVSGVVATILDPNRGLPSQYAATVDWGDGTTSAGLVSIYQDRLIVYASHTYAASGWHPYGVIVQKVGFLPVTTTGLIQVNQLLPQSPTIPPETPMSIVSTTTTRTRRGVTQILVTLGGTIEVSTASIARRFVVTDAGKDHKLGTRDDRTIRITSARYDSKTHTVTLSPKGSFAKSSRFRVVMTG